MRSYFPGYSELIRGGSQADKVAGSNPTNVSQLPSWQPSVDRGTISENDAQCCLINKGSQR